MISRIYLSPLFTCILSSILVRSDTFQENEQNQNACEKFGTNPNFDPQMLLGPQWRIYYTWYGSGKNDCLAMKFYKVNTWIVSRFYREMGQYLKEQPLWMAAILYVTIGPLKEQMLMFNDTGIAGRLHGVPNLIRNPLFMKQKMKKIVPLMQFQMKLLEDDQYLVIMDCIEGNVALSKRDLVQPYRVEIDSVANKLSLGNGSVTCKPRDLENELRGHSATMIRLAKI